MKCFSNSNTFFWCLGNVNLPWQKCLKKSYSPNENALISRCHMICVNFVTKTNELSFFSIRQYNVGCNVSHVKLALTCFYKNFNPGTEKPMKKAKITPITFSLYYCTYSVH